MSSSTSGGGSPPLADLLEIDAACDRFEAAWRSGQRPELALYLAEASEPSRPKMLRELLILELDYQFKLGVDPDPIEYRARYPEHSDIVAAVFAQFEPTLRTHAASASIPAGQGSWAAPGESTSNQATHPSEALPRADLSREALEELRSAGYEILGELGRGGMGVVYLANKLALNRRCALKMILAGAHLSPAASARFRGEAETIARLRHPGIVQIFHVGTVGGLPYFELEYLAGGSLDKRLDGTPWSAPAAAELVETLARAIAEAHRQGVVHRDLKPANILLDPGLLPKVADFGLAKLIDSGEPITRTHTVLGSPSYMAPEQAQGNARLVGPTTDVYALGAIFYELLTGRPPFRAATAVETLVQVRDSDPIPPSRFQPGLARAAETICLKCLEKAPGRRYPTAEDLAEDLRRFRAGESILAHPAPAWEQAWRWTRRRPAVAAAVGVSAVAIALVLGGVAYYNARLREAATKAREAERAALTQRNLALNAFDQLVFDVQERLGDTAATRASRRSLLDTAIKGLDDIAQGTEGTAPDLSRAVAHQKLGEIYQQIGRVNEARRQLELARGLAEKLAAGTPNDLAVAECLRDAMAGLGAVRNHDHRYAEARDLLHRVVALSEQIAQRGPRRPGARRGLIEAYLELGRAYGFDGQHGESERCYQRMHDLAERWVNDEPANLSARDLLASSYRKLADERRIVGDHDAARRNYLKAIAIGHEVLAADPGNFIFKRHLATAADDLAGVCAEPGPNRRGAGAVRGGSAVPDGASRGRPRGPRVAIPPRPGRVTAGSPGTRRLAVHPGGRAVRPGPRAAAAAQPEHPFRRSEGAEKSGNRLAQDRDRRLHARSPSPRRPRICPCAAADGGLSPAHDPLPRNARAGPTARVPCGGRGAVRPDGQGGGRPVSPGASPRGVSRSARRPRRDHARGAQGGDAAAAVAPTAPSPALPWPSSMDSITFKRSATTTP